MYKDNICDVPGVKVGHVTIEEGEIRTGLTVIMPPGKNIFESKYLAACHIINGFGKSTGLMQVEEMGTLETPIVLTNTFAVGEAYTGLVQYMLSVSDDTGNGAPTVNPVVMECNDGVINDIRKIRIRPIHVLEAIGNAGTNFEEGSVGAGRGMMCYGLKGGIGSASETVRLGGRDYNIGILLNSNFGSISDLTLYGDRIGERISGEETEDKGSVVVVLATDLPVSERQIKRMLKRVQNGIARTGSFTGSGSGDVCIGFTTANRVERKVPEYTVEVLNEKYLNVIFKTVVEITERAILKSLLLSETTPGVKRKVYGLRDAMEEKGIRNDKADELVRLYQERLEYLL